MCEFSPLMFYIRANWTSMSLFIKIVVLCNFYQKKSHKNTNSFFLALIRHCLRNFDEIPLFSSLFVTLFLFWHNRVVYVYIVLYIEAKFSNIFLACKSFAAQYWTLQKHKISNQRGLLFATLLLFSGFFLPISQTNVRLDLRWRPTKMAIYCNIQNQLGLKPNIGH